MNNKEEYKPQRLLKRSDSARKPSEGEESTNVRSDMQAAVQTALNRYLNCDNPHASNSRTSVGEYTSRENSRESSPNEEGRSR